MALTLFENEDETNRQPKWFNSSVICYEDTLKEIKKYLPSHERRSFGVVGNDRSRLNERLEMIVRKPFNEDLDYIPVGVVSKEYVLIQHAEIVDVAITAFNESKIDFAQARTELKISEYGERMALSIYLPNEFAFDPGDGNALTLRLECFNSVDGSTRFRVLMGWFRFVCSNGLITGVTQSDMRRRHFGDLSLKDIGSVLTAGIKQSESERENFTCWRKHTFKTQCIEAWVDKDLKKTWGFKAAARTYHIARTGHDASIDGPYKGNSPTTIPVRSGDRVPGAPNFSSNLFDISQILAWLAKERRDVQEQLQWREQISELLKPLMN